MNFFIFVIAICLFISLFCLHKISRDDLLFIRKDISMDKLFNIFFLVFFAGLLLSRVVYVLLYSPKMFMDPLAFLLFPYFPGLSLIGGVIGGLIFITVYSRMKNIPFGRIVDHFLFSFISSLPIGILGYFLLSGAKNYFSLITSAIFILFFYLVIRYPYQLLLKGTIRDGSLGLIILTAFSLILFIEKIILNYKEFAFVKLPENYLHLMVFVVCVGLFVKQERIITTKKR
ncbi:MAG: prolipoprotein diacylglyceryl transferase family protein [Patescibacteria group bacterium]